MIPQFFNLSSFVIFVATLHLSCSLFVRNGTVTHETSSSSPFVLTDLNSTDAKTITSSEVVDEGSAGASGSAAASFGQSLAHTLVVSGDAAHSDLESILMNKAMRVLDKEEIVFDLERQKLELELKLLDKKFDDMNISHSEPLMIPAVEVAPQAPIGVDVLTLQENIPPYVNTTEVPTETPTTEETLTSTIAETNMTLAEVPVQHVAVEHLQNEAPTPQTIETNESTGAPITINVNTNASLHDHMTIALHNPLTNETKIVEVMEVTSTTVVPIDVVTVEEPNVTLATVVPIDAVTVEEPNVTLATVVPIGAVNVEEPNVTLTNTTFAQEIPVQNVTIEHTMPVIPPVAVVNTTEIPVDVDVNTNVSVHNPLTNETQNVELNLNVTLPTIVPIGAVAAVNVEDPNITVANTTVAEAVPVLNITVEQQEEETTTQTVAVFNVTEVPVEVNVNQNISLHSPLTNDTEVVEVSTVLTLTAIEPVNATVELISSTETETTTPSTETTATATAVIVEGTTMVVDATTVIADGTTVVVDGATVVADATTVVVPDATTVVVPASTIVVSGSTSFDYLKKASGPAIKGSIAAIVISLVLSFYALNVS